MNMTMHVALTYKETKTTETFTFSTEKGDTVHNTLCQLNMYQSLGAKLKQHNQSYNGLIQQWVLNQPESKRIITVSYDF